MQNERISSVLEANYYEKMGNGEEMFSFFWSVRLLKILTGSKKLVVRDLLHIY